MLWEQTDSVLLVGHYWTFKQQPNSTSWSTKPGSGSGFGSGEVILTGAGLVFFKLLMFGCLSPEFVSDVGTSPGPERLLEGKTGDGWKCS